MYRNESIIPLNLKLIIIEPKENPKEKDLINKINIIKIKPIIDIPNNQINNPIPNVKINVLVKVIP